MLWKKKVSANELNAWSMSTIHEALGIEFVSQTEDSLIAKMPVDNRTRQPFGLLHGGASCVLAESLGSVASVLAVDAEANQIIPVGTEVQAHHLTSAREGYVIGVAKAVHLGKTTHLWSIEITDENSGALVCLATLRVFLKSKDPKIQRP